MFCWRGRVQLFVRLSFHSFHSYFYFSLCCCKLPEAGFTISLSPESGFCVHVVTNSGDFSFSQLYKAKQQEYTEGSVIRLLKRVKWHVLINIQLQLLSSYEITHAWKLTRMTFGSSFRYNQRHDRSIQISLSYIFLVSRSYISLYVSQFPWQTTFLSINH